MSTRPGTRAGKTRGSQRVRGGARWIDEHLRDPYVQRARAAGYRSRAAYKLLEIDARDRLLAPGRTVVDLGAAPGSWSQVAAQRIGRAGRVIAIDLLPIAPIPGVTILQGDFSADEALDRLRDALGGARVDLVLSDLAPNLSGIASADQARSIALAELAAEFAGAHLQPSGALLVKAFQGSGFPEYVRDLRARFESVVTRKPDASRDRSSEIFIVAKSPRGP
jgi:23S rRNA (uridine2552-2'-O)-methyltransferase